MMGSTKPMVTRPSDCAHREVSHQAIMSTKVILNSSDGCTETGPSKIHRRAPDTLRPRTKTVTRPTSPST